MDRAQLLAELAHAGTQPEDLLAEMESMCGGADRCRWPLDQPYAPGH
jgi:hypothetical protein